ncbi:MAG: glycosyltransferase family 2 protein, partial [Actinomycetota bacterium]
SSIGEPLVLDRSGAPPTNVGAAEVVAIDWEDDDHVRRCLAERGVSSFLALSDAEELVVGDAEAVRADLALDPWVLLDTPTGPELRGTPTGDLISRVGGVGPRVLPGAFVRPLDDGPIRTTIVVPTFNRPRVADAVRDALLQHAEGVEVVVVNDAGLDPRPSLGGLVDADRLRVVEAERNRGLGAARNLGMRHATGEQVLFLDDDDHILADHVADLERHLRATDAPMVTGGAVMVHHDEQGTEVARYRRPTPAFDRSLLLVHNFVVVHTALTRLRSALDVGGFDESLTVLEDWEFWIRLTSRASAVTVPVWSAEYHLSERHGENVIQHSAGRQLEALRSVYSRHPVTDPDISARRREKLTEHEVELARVGPSWAATIGVIGRRDPFRTAAVVEQIRQRHPKAELQVIVHQQAHTDTEAAFRPLLEQATWCVDQDLRPEVATERLAAQSLGRELEIVDVDRVPTSV